MRNIFLVFLVFFYPITAFSAIDEYKTDVYFTNGIMMQDTDSAGNEVNKVRTVNVVAPTITSIKVESNVTTLNVGKSAQLTVQAMYSDGSSEVLNENIEFIVTPDDTVDVNGSVITAKKDGNVTVKAQVGSAISNELNFTITWIVDGHVLPPEPDSVENDATLGGVDSNYDGVRDDVERKIYEKYPVQLQRELLMDGAKYFQKIMTESTNEARELKKEGTRVTNCELYLMGQDSEINSDDFDRITFLENYTVNNKVRVQKYLGYNLALSGGSYGSSPSDWNKDACSEAVRKVLVEMGK